MRPRWARTDRAPRRPRATALGALAAAGALLAALAAAPQAALGEGALSSGERAAIVALGPWPPPPVHDPANPASGDPQGVALGESLFHSPRLSPTGLRCASCHEPWRGFVDGRVVAQGAARGSRNTPSLLDAARHRHFGWDGARDALGEQSLRPLADPREMPATDADVAALVRGDPALSARYRQVFGQAPGADDARVTHDVGLALAAYIETLRSPRTPFDDGRDHAAAGSGDAPLAGAASRGLRLFVGAAGCIACHAGPDFTDDALHASLVHSRGPDGRPDAGHPGALPNAFRTPGLRGVAATAPYLHDGSAATLCDAIRPHAVDADTVPPDLDARQRSDVVAFLATLSAHPAATPASCGP
jgi:cytochrome c peroxidase